MAIQFARLEYVSRSTGGNACRKAAYSECTSLKCERTGELFYFEHKEDGIYHFIPPHTTLKAWPGVSSRLFDKQ